MLQRLERRVSPAGRRRRRMSPVTAALLASVTCSAPSESVHAIHVSTVPKHRSRVPVGVERVEQALDLGGRRRSARAGSRRARSARQSPIVRRSCQPIAGPTGSPVARSHTTVEPALVGDPDRVDGPGCVERGARGRRGRGRHRGGVELDQAAARASRGAARCELLVDERCASARTTAARTMTCRRRRRARSRSASDVTARRGRRTGRAGRACPG